LSKTGNANGIEGILGILRAEGAQRYGGERISQLEHGLQCGWLAERAEEPSSLVVAALLHDIGHLIEGGDEGLASEGIDARHEETGARYLARWFGPEVTEPIRLHVAAKRYLCQVDEHYFARLSLASIRSLDVQGGVYSPSEAEVFASLPHAKAATKLRRWDEEAKDPLADPPDLQHFRSHLLAALAPDAE
jgi:phosphonate degradation associated HDIG domain protein